jgi:hypothetical protein
MHVLRGVLAATITTILVGTLGVTPSWATGAQPDSVGPLQCTPYVYPPVWDSTQAQLWGEAELDCNQSMTSLTEEVILWRNNGNGTYTRVGDFSNTQTGSDNFSIDATAYDIRGCTSTNHVYHTEGIFAYVEGSTKRTGWAVNGIDRTFTC